MKPSNAPEQPPTFTAGKKLTIHQRPLTQEQPEGEATLIKCLRGSSHFDYPGLIVEEWEVKFDGESKTYERIIAAELAKSE